MCPACGQVEIEALFEAGDHTYVACPTCGSARLDPPPTDATQLYGRDYFVGGTVAGGYADYGIDETLHRRNALERLTRIADSGIQPPGTLAEIGAGYGYFLDEARREGWEVTGTDVSAHARNEAAKLDLALETDLHEVVSPVDVLAAFQVLEHIVDPAAALVNGTDLVRNGGLVIVETWDRGHWLARSMGQRWQQVSPPSVVHLFTADGLRSLAARAGLTRVEVNRTPKFVSLGAIAGHLATDLPRLRPALDRVRASAFGKRPFRYRLGDLVTLTGFKN